MNYCDCVVLLVQLEFVKVVIFCALCALCNDCHPFHHLCAADEEGDEDMDFIDGNMDDLAFLDDIASSPQAAKRGLKFADELNADSQDDEDRCV